MIVALSVYSGDAAAAQRLLDWIAELGGVGSHTLVLATTPQVNPEPLMASARKAWGSVEQFLVNTHQEARPWPISANLSFAAVCNYLKPRGLPFFFLEPDCTPIVANWLDQLEREYHANQKPFMGVVHNMVDPRNGQPVPGSLHMNGAGIYPANAEQHLPTLAFLTGALENEPWDIALRWEILYRVLPTGGFAVDASGERVSGCHATDKICFCWRTQNYRIENDSLTYDVIGHRTHLAQLDFWKHVLHHGCKDGTIIDVLRKRINPGAVMPTATPSAEGTWTVHDGAGHHHLSPDTNMVAIQSAPKLVTKIIGTGEDLAVDEVVSILSQAQEESREPGGKPRVVAKLKGPRKKPGRKPKNAQPEPATV